MSVVKHPGMVANFCPNCGSRAWGFAGGTALSALGQVRCCHAETNGDSRFPGACGTQWLATPQQMARELLLRKVRFVGVPRPHTGLEDVARAAVDAAWDRAQKAKP